MKILDIVMALLPVILIVIALLLAGALRIVCRGAASSSSQSRAVADDPFLFPFGEMPTVPRDSYLASLAPGDRVSLVFGPGGHGRKVRMCDPSDFRAWGIPRPSGLALRSENGGRGVKPAIPNAGSGRQSPAVVLTFPKRGA